MLDFVWFFFNPVLQPFSLIRGSPTFGRAIVWGNWCSVDLPEVAVYWEVPCYCSWSHAIIGREFPYQLGGKGQFATWADSPVASQRRKPVDFSSAANKSPFPDRTGSCTGKLSWDVVSSTGCRPVLSVNLFHRFPCFVTRKKPDYLPLFLIGRIKEK